MGKLLKTTGRVLAEHKFRYMASTRDCGQCPLKSKCCPNTPARMIPRDVNEDARDVARALTGTDAFEQSRRDHKCVEMLFAHLKRIFRLNRLRLRGPRGAQDEFTLAQPSGNMWQAYLNPLGIRVAPCTYCGFWNGSAAPIIRRPACKPRFCRRSCAMSAEIEDGRSRRLLANLKSRDGGSRIQQRWGRTPMAAAPQLRGNRCQQVSI